MLKIVIDKALCIGSQTCLIEDPVHFGLDADEKAVVRKDENSKWKREITVAVNRAQKDRFLKIAKLCPTQAIRVFDEQNKQLFPEF
jgi:ferredoxin